jgi:hypothetical protein
VKKLQVHHKQHKKKRRVSSKVPQVDLKVLSDLKVIPTVDHRVAVIGRPPNVGANGRVWRNPGVIISKKPKFKEMKNGQAMRVWRGVPLIIYNMLRNRRRRKEMKRYVW